MIKKGLICCFLVVLTACAVNPTPVTVEQRYKEAQLDVKELFSPQKNISRHIDYYEALARALKYNLDYRIKLANFALQAGQLKVAEYTMFPALNASGSLYTRDNDLSSFGITPEGNPTGVLNATPRTLRSMRVALSWNILDFGLGYVRAQEQGERILIAQEEARKQEQTLAQDVLVAYWDAYNAQQLIVETNEFQRLLTGAKNRLTVAVHDKLVPQENILNYQGSLLEGNRRLVQLQYKYNKALLDLRHLLSLPPDQPLVLAAPPLALRNAQNLGRLDFEKLDAITLVKRPELSGEEYQKRIAEHGVKIAILQALPGITLNDGWNYNSNKFLINHKWMDRSVDLAWNLLNLASLPTTYQAAKLGVKYEKLKRMALTIAVLTETRYAYWHYKTLRDEYGLAHKVTLNSEAIYNLNRNRQIASLASDQQVILAKLRALTSKMDEQLLLSDMSTALGELYLSSGADILPIDVDDQTIPQLINLIKKNFVLQKTLNFKDYVNNTYHEIIFIPQQQRYYAEAHNKNRYQQIHVSTVPTTATTKKIRLGLAKFLTTPVKQMAPTNLPNQFVLHATSPQKYTVQVFGSYQLHEVKKYQSQLPANLPSYFGQTKRNGHDWYVLTIGQYRTAHGARRLIATLPKKMKSDAAWVRKTEGLHWLA